MARLSLAIDARQSKTGAAQFQDAVDQNVVGAANRADRAIAGLDKRTNTAGRSVGRLGGVLTRLVGPLAAIATVGRSFQLAAQAERTTVAFESLLGSAGAARKLVGELEQFAASTPFQFQGLADSARLMLALGANVNRVVPSIRAIGDAVALLGGGDALMRRIILALGQMQAKGKVTAEEMRQLAEAGIPAWKILANSIGVTIPEAMKLVERRAVDSAGAVQALLDGIQAKYVGGAERASKTVGGLFSTLRDNINFALRDVGNVLVEALDVRQLLSGAISVTRDFADWIRNGKTEVTALTTAVQALAAALAVLTGAGLLRGLGLLAIKIKAVSIAFVATPFGAVAAGLAAIAAAAVLVNDRLDTMGRRVNALGNSFDDLPVALKGSFQKADPSTLGEFQFVGAGSGSGSTPRNLPGSGLRRALGGIQLPQTSRHTPTQALQDALGGIVTDDTLRQRAELQKQMVRQMTDLAVASADRAARAMERLRFVGFQIGDAFTDAAFRAVAGIGSVREALAQLVGDLSRIAFNEIIGGAFRNFFGNVFAGGGGNGSRGGTGFGFPFTRFPGGGGDPQTGNSFFSGGGSGGGEGGGFTGGGPGVTVVYNVSTRDYRGFRQADADLATDSRRHALRAWGTA